MKIEDMCIKEGLYFRDYIAERYYCKLGYCGKKVDCEYFGEKDESLLHVCEYDKMKKEQKGEKQNGF